MFKLFDKSRDIREKTSPVNEVIFLDKNIFTGSTGGPGETNIRKFAHWTSGSVSGSLFQALYNTNFTSASAVVLANITYGQSISSSFYLSAAATNKVEKNKVYRLFAKMLLGDEDSLFTIGGTTRNELIFLCINRSQMKDELKKQAWQVNSVFSGSWSSKFSSRTFTDDNASNVWVQDIRGDYANLYSGSSVGGLLYYQAGVAVLVPEVFSNTSSNTGNPWSGTLDYGSLATTGNFENLLNGCRYRFDNITFTNQSNLQSAYYFIRMQNDEFNYSSNPTWVDSSGRIITTSGSTNYGPIVYPTKVGLLGENNEVLAVACINTPLKKSFENEQGLIVRLDY
jgi:hypothetical protein